jgi:hypothetical protein
MYVADQATKKQGAKGALKLRKSKSQSDGTFKDALETFANQSRSICF